MATASDEGRRASTADHPADALHAQVFGPSAASAPEIRPGWCCGALLQYRALMTTLPRYSGSADRALDHLQRRALQLGEGAGHILHFGKGKACSQVKMKDGPLAKSIPKFSGKERKSAR